MGVYDDMRTAGNPGWCLFDADLLPDLASRFNFEEVLIRTTADGHIITIRDAGGQLTERLRDILVHLENRPSRDNAKDVLVIPVEKLATLGNIVQARLSEFEQVPYGRRVGNRPPQVK